MLTRNSLAPVASLHVRTLRQRCPEMPGLGTRPFLLTPPPNNGYTPERTQVSKAGFQVQNPQEPQAGRYELLTCNIPHRGGPLTGTTCSLTQADKVVGRGHVPATGGVGTLPGTPGKLGTRGSLSTVNTHPWCQGPETLPTYETWIAPMGIHESGEPTGSTPPRKQKSPQEPSQDLEQPLMPQEATGGIPSLKPVKYPKQ